MNKKLLIIFLFFGLNLDVESKIDLKKMVNQIKFNIKKAKRKIDLKKIANEVKSKIQKAPAKAAAISLGTIGTVGVVASIISNKTKPEELTYFHDKLLNTIAETNFEEKVNEFQTLSQAHRELKLGDVLLFEVNKTQSQEDLKKKLVKITCKREQDKEKKDLYLDLKTKMVVQLKDNKTVPMNFAKDTEPKKTYVVKTLSELPNPVASKTTGWCTSQKALAAGLVAVAGAVILGAGVYYYYPATTPEIPKPIYFGPENKPEGYIDHIPDTCPLEIYICPAQESCDVSCQATTSSSRDLVIFKQDACHVKDTCPLVPQILSSPSGLSEKPVANLSPQTPNLPIINPINLSQPTPEEHLLRSLAVTSHQQPSQRNNSLAVSRVVFYPTCSAADNTQVSAITIRNTPPIYNQGTTACSEEIVTPCAGHGICQTLNTTNIDHGICPSSDFFVGTRNSTTVDAPSTFHYNITANPPVPTPTSAAVDPGGAAPAGVVIHHAAEADAGTCANGTGAALVAPTGEAAAKDAGAEAAEAAEKDQRLASAEIDIKKYCRFDLKTEQKLECFMAYENFSNLSNSSNVDFKRIQEDLIKVLQDSIKKCDLNLNKLNENNIMMKQILNDIKEIYHIGIHLLYKNIDLINYKSNPIDIALDAFNLNQNSFKEEVGNSYVKLINKINSVLHNQNKDIILFLANKFNNILKNNFQI